jgi:predicted MPP superfamily phosphohydrolase
LVAFVALIVVVVGLIHFYLWKRLVKDPFRPGRLRKAGAVVAVALAVLVPATLIGVRSGYVEWLAWPGYIWLALMFYLFVTLLVLEVPRLAISLWLRVAGRHAAVSKADATRPIETEAATARTADATSGTPRAGDASPETAIGTAWAGDDGVAAGQPPRANDPEPGTTVSAARASDADPRTTAGAAGSSRADPRTTNGAARTADADPRTAASAAHAGHADPGTTGGTLQRAASLSAAAGTISAGTVSTVDAESEMVPAASTEPGTTPSANTAIRTPTSPEPAPSTDTSTSTSAGTNTDTGTSTSTAGTSTSTAGTSTSTAGTSTSTAGIGAGTNAANARDNAAPGPSQDPSAQKGIDRRLLLARGAAIFAGLTAAGVTGYGVKTALGPPQLDRVQFPMAKLPRAMDGTRLALVSDIHLGPLTGSQHASRIVNLINSVNADVVCVVGDLVDGSVAELGRFAAPLADIQSRRGAYFVTGNHEYYSGHEEWVAEVARLGVQPLRNERLELAGLDLAGVNDIGGVEFGDGPDLRRALGDRDTSRPVVLMAHQPVVARDAASFGVDLQVSGHTHGGQMAPFNLLVKLEQPVVSGLGKVDGVPVYVTNGAGFWGPPVRVGAPPQVTVIELRTP